MSENELNILASALRSLTPSSPPLDRDALMFRAGRASASRRGWLWPMATVASTFVALGFGLALLMRPAEVKTVDRIVYREAPAPAPAPEVEPQAEPPSPEGPTTTPLASPWEPPASRYDQVRDNLLRWGLDGLPPAPKTRHTQTSAADELLRPF